MNVLICTETYHPYTSGVVTHIETLKAGLEEAGCRVMVVAAVAGLKRQVEEDGVLYCPGVELKRIYGYGLALPFSQQRLEAVERFGPDVVHIHTEFTMGLFGQWVAACLQIPIVYTAHTYYDDYVTYVTGRHTEALGQRLMRRYVGALAGKAAAVVAPSSKVAAYLGRGGYKGAAHILPNTVDTGAFSPASVDAGAVQSKKEELGIEPGDTCLCFVGRLGAEKSVRELVETFTAAFRGEARYKLFLLGDGPEREALKALIAAQGMEGQVFLLGKIAHEALPVYHQCFDLFTTASLSEVHSIALIEAHAAGLYAIDRLDEANRAQIREGADGEYYTTAEEFEQAVRRYAGLAAQQKAAMRTAIARHAGRYGPAQYAQGMLCVYNGAIASLRAGKNIAFAPDGEYAEMEVS